MRSKIKKLLENMENKNHKVVEVNSKSFKLENGDEYPHNFDLVGDMMALIASFSGRLHGRRSAKRRKKDSK